MKRAVWLLFGGALSLALLTIPQGCSSDSTQALPSATPPPEAPHPVTDLSQLAPGNPLDPFASKHEQTVARKIASGGDLPGRSLENFDQLATVRHAGDDKHPCDQRLLNKKAALFDVLSMRLMDQVFHQMIILQTGEISRMKLPSDLKWVIITGRMNSHGVLKELILEQHSGTAAVDKLMIAACKKALYLQNPPADAANSEGNYEVRIESRMENYASLDGEHWYFKTYLGIALM